MNQAPTALVKFDRFSWYFFSGWFGLATLALVVAGSFARDLAFWGLVLLLVNAGARLVMVARQFLRRERNGFVLLCGLLLVILVASVVLQLLIRN